MTETARSKKPPDIPPGRQSSGKTIALIQVPNQRLFKLRAAASYLDLHPHTLRKYADLGRIEARCLNDERGRRHRVFTLEALDRFIDSLPDWYHGPGEESGTERRNDGY